MSRTPVPSLATELWRRQMALPQRLWQRLPLMDRWLTSELLGPLLFGIAAFTAVSLSVGVVFELVRKVAEAGLPPLVAMQVLGLRLPGAGADAVSLYEYKDTIHGLITYADRYPCHVWFGQPYEKFEYDRTDLYFKKKLHSFTPSIEGSFNYGYHYQMYRMAATFREMVLTRKEPVPHPEILEVTAIVHAAAKSLTEKSRLVKLAELMG